MRHSEEILLTDLRRLVADLGKDGGQYSPSIYDTAQHLRLAPPASGVWPAVDWLVAQQHADGGWGPTAMPMARDIPTLAAVLALHTHAAREQERAAIARGLAFLRRQAPLWSKSVPEDIPVGAELILPQLLDTAAAVELPVPARVLYAPLYALGTRRRALIAEFAPGAGSTAVYSWEAWGEVPDPSLLDHSGGVGHSPAATAAWLRAAAERPKLAAERAGAYNYLQTAAAATGTGIPGVVPGVWPYPRNEQNVSLYILLLAGLLDHPALAEVVHAQLADMWRGLRSDGQGISDWFASDGDNTAMAFSVLQHAGYRPDRSVLEQYISGDTCLTYRRELQRSFSATTHAAHALALLDGNPQPLLDYLCRQRRDDQLWAGDKWHASWTYLTSHTLIALLATGRIDDVMSAVQPLIDRQCADGRWGVDAAADEETAHVVLALLAIDRAGLLPSGGQCALHRAGRWLAAEYRPLHEANGACWIGKELYRPRRIARVLALSATLCCLQSGYAA